MMALMITGILCVQKLCSITTNSTSHRRYMIHFKNHCILVHCIMTDATLKNIIAQTLQLKGNLIFLHTQFYIISPLPFTNICSVEWTQTFAWCKIVFYADGILFELFIKFFQGLYLHSHGREPCIYSGFALCGTRLWCGGTFVYFWAFKAGPLFATHTHGFDPKCRLTAMTNHHKPFYS